MARGGMSTIPFTRSVFMRALGLMLLHEKFLQFDWLRAVVFQHDLYVIFGINTTRDISKLSQFLLA